MASIEASNPAKEHLLIHNDSSDGISTAKAKAASDEREIGNPGAPETVPEQPPRLYWVRSLVLISIPPIIAAYYGVIWVALVQNSVYDEAVKYRTFSGSLIFYSWFIIGVFALSWAKFGLLGVEASMLRTRFWRAPNLVALLMHSNGTWSSPSGWVKAVVHREFYRLWCLLTFISVLPFIAVPLSGLVFEISDGYIATSGAPSLLGRNKTTFNVRYDAYSTESVYRDRAPAPEAWRMAATPTIPGVGIIYTRESVDRSNHSAFEALPNSLPLNESIPDLFLPPQADKPVSGKAWGLRIKYDCSIVRSASEFTILGQKPASSILEELEDGIRLRTPSGDILDMWESFGQVAESGQNVYNTQAYYEVGQNTYLESLGDQYNGTHPGFDAGDGEGLVVFEYAAWQFRVNTLHNDKEKALDDNVEPSIEGMGSPYVEDNGNFTVNNTFFALKGDVLGPDYPNKMTDASDLFMLDSIALGSSYGTLLSVADPIGVRCVASSDVGTAELDGVTSTFGNFQRDPPDFDEYHPFGALRFGQTARYMLNGQYYQHYKTGDLPGTVPDEAEHGHRYGSFVTPEALLRSVNLAFALDAFNLMYDINSYFKRPWSEPEDERGLTSSREGKILSVASLIPGAAVGYFVLALFCVWAALSVGLGLWYGFRWRPADRLDGYVMLRKGADMADELKGNGEFMSGKSFHDSGTLAALSGDVLGAKG